MPSGGLAPPSRLLDLAARASAASRAGDNPDALHTTALIDLQWSDGVGNSLQRSISYLQAASRLSDRPAPAFADLAAAHLVRAERAQTPRDLLEAVEAAARALELDHENEVARFNLAVALDRIGLVEQAAGAWRAYLEVDSTSGWAEDAKARLRAATVARAVSARPTLGSPLSEVDAYVATAPQEARLLGWEHALGEWGAAVLRGDTAGAARHLHLASALGQALERRGGDATLAEAVGAIHARTGDVAATRSLARAHRAYALGQSAHVAARFEDAGRSFAQAVALADGSAPLRGWASLFRAAELVHMGRPDDAAPAIQALIARTDTTRHAALAAHARWALGTARVRSGRYEEALTLYRAASELFARAGETEHLGAVRFLSAATEYAVGAVADVHGSMHRALATLRPHRRSVWLHGLLYAWADAAAAEGFISAAVQIQDEGVAVAYRTEVPPYVAEARLARARLLVTAGHGRRAAEEARAARALTDGLTSSTARRWLRAESWLVEAVASSRADPSRAAAALDSVVAFFDALRNPARLLPALVARAEARLAFDSVSAAEVDLRRAAALIEEQRGAITSAPLRAALLEGARRIVDRLVMLRVAAGHPTEALDILEQGRLSFGPVGSSQPGRGRASHRMPRGQVALDYALIGDTLLVWTVADTAVHFRRATVDRARLLSTVERARSSLELRADEAAVRPELTALYDWLIRPLAPRLGREGTPLVVIADGEIAGVPFAALYDTARRHYLVEDHSLRFASSWEDAVRGAAATGPRRARPAAATLLVADPAFDPRAFPGLARLSGAADEVRAVAAEYREATVLGGEAADRAALTSALVEAGIAHYAGHAVFDDDRPERSYLVLAPPRDGGNGAARLSAAEIGQFDLRRLRLVVLSACQSSRAQPGRSGGFAGLTGAFLAAGAGGVVGSLWRVDDELTRPLMVEFHRAFRASGDGAAALRAAQLHALRSLGAPHRSPAAWASFRYAGS